ncbi:putative ubiquitin hydrolase [Anopheles sinensis]|uniref:Putative ubiquitin hydrolase n=1 Tax=Anopheles sinensis TaxID=74873 RepID=A0A084VKR3_ANOSI|nr:putative ubiquitin hydrolase [Anopheles sinensis]
MSHCGPPPFRKTIIFTPPTPPVADLNRQVEPSEAKWRPSAPVSAGPGPVNRMDYRNKSSSPATVARSALINAVSVSRESVSVASDGLVGLTPVDRYGDGMPRVRASQG